MTHREILDEIVDCIAVTDAAELFSVGDRLMEVIAALKEEWAQTQTDIITE